ncbi:MAG: FAD-binding oxidoreductase [Streptosporangiales bacterium]|nr:FAD-binding oxidoreductase [Streptosporangiales bacterium]
MRRILIVGAGQGGLQLALCLQARGYEITMMSARTPEEIRAGRVTSTQVMFWTSLDIERENGLDLWEPSTPRIVGQRSTVAAPPDEAPPGTMGFTFIGRWDSYAQSVDQRVKMAGWLELFEQRGGNVVYHGAMTSDLERLSELYDLTIIAAGKGELVELFDRDAGRSPYDRPQRHLAGIYVHGSTPMPEYPEPHVRINVVPGVGEAIIMPGYTHTGACEILLWEAIPGGPLDVWDDRPGPGEHLRRTLELLGTYLPWEYERFKDAEPTDARSTLIGGYAPVVRDPVGRLSDTALVFGMGDVVVANDPITGQGANNACHCADIYLKRILAHGDRPFDEKWMRETFEEYWEYAGPVTRYTNMVLGPPPEHLLRVLGAAVEHPEVAYRFVRGSAYPGEFQDWIMEAESVDAYLASVGA